MTQTEKKQIGRPRKPDAEKLKLSQVRVTDAEREAFARVARKMGMSYSEFLRQAGRRALHEFEDAAP